MKPDFSLCLFVADRRLHSNNCIVISRSCSLQARERPLMAASAALRLCLLLALLLVVMIDVGGGRGRAAGAELSACRPLDPCRGGVGNEACCKAIAASITAQGCSCVCKFLINYGVPNLTSDCYKSSWCTKCNRCTCSKSLWSQR
ncbi:hypothetical protein MUK42_31178 [Musa troglodytarum]|uniref:Uncharacterized protein n=1 Tax=Musa troglodytarum TaxID=320322 RepID=A0A9E7FII2_9LILI|nr:hypothetical protein MUK42_31178 [Musa troglodytarum]